MRMAASKSNRKNARTMGAAQYRRCISSLGWPEATWAELEALANRFGLSAVELRTLEGRLDLPALWTERFGEPAKLVAPGRRPVIALGTSAKLFNGGDSAREELLAWAPWAEAMGARWLRVFDGASGLGQADFAQAAELLGWWQETRKARAWRVDLAIETHDSLLNSASLLELLAAAPQARVLWDTHHTWRRGGESPSETWRQVASAVVHIHVKDSIDQPSARHPYTYTLPGEGQYPMPELRSALIASRYEGGLSLEWELKWHPYLPSLESALQAASQAGWW
jgi:sugar phosphate isomerase/epimerase